MAEKRSLGAALSLTPEKVAFIKNDKNDASETANRPETHRQETDDRKTRQPQPTAPTYSPTLVSVTTRLQQGTAEALRNAYLEQKLNRQFPDTQQEIIEEALQHWLYERGFLS
ncbi:hypothetical protein V7x_40840 [Crateriforma conspicua]|uniref:Uncharacterized protein n=1 Tax=Crateriforma conspicua TaxID=2527996 RepID=A0A5C6FJD1_9PLAN|nr:hypothetical protein [Crateriforma conspicua]TWU62355.1 hypothetical protein V7x_40840 [Crateriforma conspicua]